MADEQTTQAPTPTGDGAPNAAPDRAAAAGLPPDSGPEQDVMRIRPSLWRGHPFASVLLLIAPVAIGVSTGILATPIPGLITFGVVALLAWAFLGIWYLNHTVSRSIRITNKRTIERRGLLSRSEDEVLHDHVRNIQVDQSFVERIFNVGRIGISSSGQAGIEIEMRDLPDPDRIREVIDLYRPL